MSVALSSAPSRIDRFFAEDVPAFVRELQAIEDDLPPGAAAREDDYFAALGRAMARSGEACAEVEDALGDDAEALKRAKARFQEAIGPWFDQSWYAFRGRHRPRGHVGDFETLEVGYDGVPRSKGLGGYIDLHFLRLPIVRGVRGRLRETERFLLAERRARPGPISILDVACGPCREWRAPAWRGETGAAATRVVCLDSDQGALDWSRAALHDAGTDRAVSFEFRHENALHMTDGDENVRRFGRFDVVYSVGLVDYIPDGFLIGMLRGWRAMLKPGGALYVSFKDRERYDRFPVEWHVGWHWVRRADPDFRRIFAAAGLGGAVAEPWRDETGTILIYACRP